jgi:hypothetical protein
MRCASTQEFKFFSQLHLVAKLWTASSARGALCGPRKRPCNSRTAGFPLLQLDKPLLEVLVTPKNSATKRMPTRLIGKVILERKASYLKDTMSLELQL